MHWVDHRLCRSQRIIFRGCRWAENHAHNNAIEGIKSCMCDKLLHSYPTLCDPMDCSPLGFSVHGSLQARNLEWVVISSSRRFFRPRNQIHVSCGSCVTGKFFTIEPQSWIFIGRTDVEAETPILRPPDAKSWLIWKDPDARLKVGRERDNRGWDGWMVSPTQWTWVFCLFVSSFIFISWRLITLQYCSGFCHTLIWISHGFTCVPHPDPPSCLPPHPIPLGLPSASALSTCLMHPTWAGDLFHPW